MKILDRIYNIVFLDCCQIFSGPNCLKITLVVSNNTHVHMGEILRSKDYFVSAREEGRERKREIERQRKRKRHREERQEKREPSIQQDHLTDVPV